MRLKTFMTFDENRQVAKKNSQQKFSFAFCVTPFFNNGSPPPFQVSHDHLFQKATKHYLQPFKLFWHRRRKRKILRYPVFLRLLLILDFALFGFAFVERVWVACIADSTTNENIKRSNWTAKLLKLLAVTKSGRKDVQAVTFDSYIFEKNCNIVWVEFFYCYAGKIQFLFVKFWLISMDLFIWQTKDRKFLSEMAPDKHYLEHILNRLSEQKNTQTKCHKKVKTQVSRLRPVLGPRLNWSRL